MSWKRVGPGLAAALAAIARPASAASPSARLTYVRSIDAAACPDEAALRGAVAQRFGYDPFFPWAKKTVVVHIGREGRYFVAHVELVDEGGLTRGTRELRADENDCAQIFDATALAISIALDAFAASPGDGAPPTSPATAPAPPPGGIEAPWPSAPPPAAPAPSPESVSPIPARPWRTQFAAGADVLGALGAAPGGAAGLGAFVDARSAGASIELRLHADASPIVSVRPVGAVAVGHLVATLAPCARFGALYACGLGEVGSLRAWGSGLETVTSQAMPFVAAGVRFGAALVVSSSLEFRIYAEGVFDLDRARLELDYNDVWTAPVVEGMLAMGLARRIP